MEKYPDLFVNDSSTEKDTYTHLTSAWGVGWNDPEQMYEASMAADTQERKRPEGRKDWGKHRKDGKKRKDGAKEYESRDEQNEKSEAHGELYSHCRLKNVM